MSYFAIASISILLIFTISQFGGRLSARNSFVWWLVTAFMILALVFPDILIPLAKFLGISLVSNLVMASLIVFLFLQSIELTSELTRYQRRFRNFVSHEARRMFSRPKDAITTHNALVVLPTYNEEESLPELIPQLKKIHEEHGIDFCFIDDGSVDSTCEILQKTCPNHYVTHPSNIGVSGVLITGFKLAQNCGYNFVVQCDSDGQHPVDEIPRLVREAQRSQTHLLIGSRFCDPAEAKKNYESTTLSRRLGIMVIRFCLSFFGLYRNVKDPTSGLRVYNREAFTTLVKAMPDDYPEPESIAILAVKGMKIKEVSVTMKARLQGESSIGFASSIRYMLKVFSSLLGLRLRSTLP